jgi:hypothetical protein
LVLSGVDEEEMERRKRGEGVGERAGFQTSGGHEGAADGTEGWKVASDT